MDRETPTSFLIHPSVPGGHGRIKVPPGLAREEGRENYTNGAGVELRTTVKEFVSCVSWDMVYYQMDMAEDEMRHDRVDVMGIELKLYAFDVQGGEGGMAEARKAKQGMESTP